MGGWLTSMFLPVLEGKITSRHHRLSRRLCKDLAKLITKGLEEIHTASADFLFSFVERIL